MTMELTQGVAPTTTRLAITAVVAHVMNKMRSGFAAYAMARRERRNIRSLQMLDDCMLADIGVARTEIAFYVRTAAGQSRS